MGFSVFEGLLDFWVFLEMSKKSLLHFLRPPKVVLGPVFDDFGGVLEVFLASSRILDLFLHLLGLPLLLVPSIWVPVFYCLFECW